MAQVERLFEAIKTGDITCLRQLVTDDPALARARDTQGTSPLMLALYHRRPDAVDVLLAGKPDLDLYEASALGDVARVGDLLAAHPGGAANYSHDGFSALHLACFFNHDVVVGLLLDHGADVNAPAQNASRVQPLHSAVAARSPEVVGLLLEAGADVDGRQQGGWTALHAAARHGDVEIARRLLARGANRSLAAEDGDVAETLARAAGQSEMVALLRDD